MVCSADVNASQSSVPTYARCGWSFNIHLTTNLPVQIRQNYGTESVAPLFFGPPCIKVLSSGWNSVTNSGKFRRGKSIALSTKLVVVVDVEFVDDTYATIGDS